MAKELYDVSQNLNHWNSFFDGLTPESEIRMWDFYGLRQWILKYVPRFGKTIEAGCGQGRVNFLLSRLGIITEGVDFSDRTVAALNNWQKNNGFNCKFVQGNVKKLPYSDNSIDSYISLGVIEHFREGPHEALNEAYRVLKPGGIAIISTPSVSWNIFLRNTIRNYRKYRFFIRNRVFPKSPKFIQYWYRPRKLKNFVEQAGLKVRRFTGADLLYSFCERGRYQGNNLKEGTFAYWFSNKFEYSFLATLGSQSITISVKLDDLMHCFLCGELNAEISSLNKFDIPLCLNCNKKEISKYYIKNRKLSYGEDYIIDPPIKIPANENCDYCGDIYLTDELFEDYGFTKKVCSSCLIQPEINIELSNIYIQPIWRRRE